jgi:hypothetical protein
VVEFTQGVATGLLSGCTFGARVIREPIEYSVRIQQRTNKLAAPNPAIASQLRLGHHGRVIDEPDPHTREVTAPGARTAKYAKHANRTDQGGRPSFPGFGVVGGSTQLRLVFP